MIVKIGSFAFTLAILTFIRLFTYSNGFLYRSTLSGSHSILTASLYPMHTSDYTAVMIVPTGIGASIGGYAGDALPAAKLLSSVCDILITHPNVLNGAMLYWPIKNAMYVEGFALDEFARGKLLLHPINKKGHKIGLLLDRAIEDGLRIRHIQVANAAKATLGIDVSDCVVTPRNVGVEAKLTPSGASWGTISDTNSLLQGAQELVNRGCTAIAVVVRFPEDDDEASAMFAQYRLGSGVDGIAGAEALISHVITKRFKIPCAHAPAFSPTDAESEVSPKSCAEELGYTFLPSVLSYLHQAPSLVPIESVDNNNSNSINHKCISSEDVDAVVVPATALGGPAVLSFLSKGVLVIAVEDNTTCMKADYDSLQLQKSLLRNINVVTARSYAEAAGILAAHKAGILIEAITSNVKPISITEL